MAKITLHPGDNRETLRRLIDQGVRVHSVVTDPPYGLVSIQKRFGKDGAAPARTEKNDGIFARLSGGFMGKCFHPDTEIMTSHGWKRVDQIQIGETIATLNPTTRDLEWQAVAQFHSYPFDGYLAHIKHRSSEQVITPNHKMLVSEDGGKTLRLKIPNQLKRKFHIFAQANPSAGTIDDVVIESVREYGKERSETVVETDRFDAKAFFKFFGLWLGDGYTVSRSNDHPANDFFGINVKKERKKIAVRDALNSLGVKFTEKANDEGYATFYIYNFALLGWLKQFGKARDKYIPHQFFRWDAECLEQLYQGLIETDGCVQGNGQEVLYTCSRQLADDFQRLCLHVGRSASVSLNQGGKIVSIRGVETVSSDNWTCCVLQAGKRMYGEKSNTSSNIVFDTPYTGEVFCVGVPKHHIIYTRFNGKPVWTGNSWDATGIERDPDFWRLIWEILLPGGYVFAFSGSRTGHWQACAMEMAGFIMHPMHGWAFGSGFPKAHAADKAIDKMLGVKGTYGGVKPGYEGHYGTDNMRSLRESGTMSQDGGFSRPWMSDPEAVLKKQQQYQAGSPEAAQWEGWAYGTQAQKPALEPIYLGQKPFSEKTGAANLLKHGVGAVNIDGCRVPTDGEVNPSIARRKGAINHLSDRPAAETEAEGRMVSRQSPEAYRADRPGEAMGRHPANLILDGSPEVAAMFPNSNGSGSARKLKRGERDNESGWGMGAAEGILRYAGDGSAARFFHQFPVGDEDYEWAIAAGIIGTDHGDPLIYQAKAGKLDRAGSKHPTVKPIALMQYLIRHITPPGGVVLDPFAGSGTTGEAAKREGFDCILMEAEPEYLDFLKSRFCLKPPAVFNLSDLLGEDAKVEALDI